MPISPATLARRHAELGQIRLGKKGDRGQPQKLECFRFTSFKRDYIEDLATLYGGTPQPWDNGGKPAFEVFSEAKSIPVVVIKGGMTQWMETWSGGGRIHQCDGEIDAVTRKPCNPDDPAHHSAKPTTHLNVMLPELEAVGAWHLTSRGWNAAAELPAVAELAQFVGDMVPAHLNLVMRRKVKDGKTSVFNVPVLDLQIGVARLREIVAAKAGIAELAAPTGAPALPAGLDAYATYSEEVSEAESLDDLQEIWKRMVEAGLAGQSATPSDRLTEFVEAFKARAAVLKNREGTAKPPDLKQPDADGIVDAELVPEAAAAGDADTVWQQCLQAGGEQGMSLGDVEDHFAQQMGGLSSAEASAAELGHYLEILRSQGAAA